MLDPFSIDSSTVDEMQSPSTNSLPDNSFTNNDLDFESEEKPKELSVMQKAKMSNKKSLKDGKKYDATLKKISGRHVEYKNMDILSVLYDVDLEDGTFKEVEDAYFFSEDNLTSASNNQERLEKCMSKFGVRIDDDDYDSIDCLRSSLEHLVGTKVSLVQETRGRYYNYKIVKVFN